MWHCCFEWDCDSVWYGTHYEIIGEISCHFVGRLTFSSELLNCLADLFVITLTGFASSYTQGVIRVRKRVTLMAVTVTVMSGVCWVSGIIVHSVYYFTSLSTIKETYSVTSTLLLLNTAAHPFVYALINRTFREKIKEMIWCSCTISTGSFSPPAVVPQYAATKQQSVSRMLSGPIMKRVTQSFPLNRH